MASTPEWSIKTSSTAGGGQQAQLVLDDGSGTLDWIRQVVVGEFDENRDLSALLADMTLSLVPGVIIVTSARDLVAITTRLSRHPERRQDIREWALLFGTVVPLAYPLIAAGVGAVGGGVGAAVTGGAAIETDGIVGGLIRSICLLLLRGGHSLKVLLSNVVHFLQSHVSGNVYAFLKKVRFADHVKPICDVVQTTITRMLHFAQSAHEVLRSYNPYYMVVDYFVEMGQKLKAFEAQYLAVQQQLVAKMSEAARWLQQKLDDILQMGPPASGPMLAAAGGDIGKLGSRASASGPMLPAWPGNPLGVPVEVAMASRAEHVGSGGSRGQHGENVHGHETRKPTMEIMPEKEVPCFKADSFAHDPKLLKEFDRQLKDQNEGLNNMTVKDYLNRRGQYIESGRGSSAPARHARQKKVDQLSDSYFDFYRDKGFGRAESESLAKDKAIGEMKGVAALHTPDMVAGGINKIPNGEKGFGILRVNSSLGSQWAKSSSKGEVTRVQIMDKYAETIPKNKQESTMMNMKLNRCK